MALPKNPARNMFLKQIGFIEDPFAPGPDPRFMYLSSQHGPLMERLTGLLDRAFGMAIVDGDPGTGKSIIARRLESYCACRPDSYTPVFIHNLGLESEYLTLAAITDRLFFPRRKGIAAQLGVLTHYIREQAEEGRTIPVIIDTKELITKDALQQLSDIAAELSPVFVFSRPQILASLSKASDSVQNAYRIKIDNLSLEDTTGMIQFRCTLAGRKTPLMDPDVIGFIWESAFGNPAKIMSLCGRLLNVMQENNLESASLSSIGSLLPTSGKEQEVIIPE